MLRTQYGPLPASINPVTGRAEIARGSSASRHTRNRAGAPVGERPRQGKVAGSSPAPAQSTADASFDSELEADFALRLEWERRDGQVKAWWHHPFSLTLSDTRKRYRPDFLVQRTDGTLEIIEVKGEHQNKRDSLTHLHWAAQRFPCFVWRLVWKKGRGWDGQYIKGVGDERGIG